MSTEELGTLIEDFKKEDFDITWVSKDKLIKVLEEIKDTEDDEEIEVIKKVVVHMNKIATGYIDENGKGFAPNDFYKLPEHLEKLNIYLPEQQGEVETTEEVVVVLTEEEEISAEIKELLKEDTKYTKICEDLETAKTNLNTFIEKSNGTINKKKTVIFNLAAKKEVAERVVKDTLLIKKVSELKEMAAALKENETNK